MDARKYTELALNLSQTIFDPVRKKNVSATPEELVRQSVVQYLMTTLHVPLQLIGVEFSLTSIHQGNFRRVDIVVWRPGKNQLEPWLVVECKSPNVKIDDFVAFQVADYLRHIPSEYVMLSNGADTRYLVRVENKYCLVPSLPLFKNA